MEWLGHVFEVEVSEKENTYVFYNECFALLHSPVFNPTAFD